MMTFDEIQKRRQNHVGTSSEGALWEIALIARAQLDATLRLQATMNEICDRLQQTVPAIMSSAELTQRFNSAIEMPTAAVAEHAAPKGNSKADGKKKKFGLRD